MIIYVAGKLRSSDFHASKKLAETLIEGKLTRAVVLPGMVDTDYEEHVSEQKRKIGVSALNFKGPCMVYTDEKVLIGGAADFAKWVAKKYGVRDNTPAIFYDGLARTEYRKWRAATGHPFYTLAFSIDGEPIGAIVIELYSDVCPKTVKNFIQLCGTGSKSYHRTPVHRIVKGGWIQAGDIVSGAGDQGECYEGGLMPDECFAIKHDRPGIIGMANHGVPHTNGSQFYITMKPTPHFDGKTVAFGRVIEGMRVLRVIEQDQTMNDRPLRSILILDAGAHTLDAKPKK